MREDYQKEFSVKTRKTLLGLIQEVNEVKYYKFLKEMELADTSNNFEYYNLCEAKKEILNTIIENSEGYGVTVENMEINEILVVDSKVEWYGDKVSIGGRERIEVKCVEEECYGSSCIINGKIRLEVF